MLSLMDSRISLKASQYIMFSRTKVQGKRILDTRSCGGRRVTVAEVESVVDGMVVLDVDGGDGGWDDGDGGDAGDCVDVGDCENDGDRDDAGGVHNVGELTMQIAFSLLLFMTSLVSIAPSFGFAYKV